MKLKHKDSKNKKNPKLSKVHFKKLGFLEKCIETRKA